jgi:endonuclease YncB( thermonuclease family)
MSAEEMVMADPSSSPSPLASTQPSSSPTPMSSTKRNIVSSNKKTITCVKNGKTIKVTGKNPKCPTGYKIKR